MQKDIIRGAIESGDPKAAEGAIHEIDLQLHSSTNAKERAPLLLNKAAFFGILKRFDDARKQLELALEEAPNEADVRLVLDFISGSLYDQEGLPDKAFARLTAILSTYAEQLRLPAFRSIYEDIQQRRAFDSARVGKFTEAIPILKECLSFDMKPADRSDILSNLGLCYSKLNNYEDARDCFLQACKIGLTNDWEGQVHFLLGIAYAHLNLLRESKLELQLCEERAAEYRLPRGKIYRWLSAVCKRLGETAQAEHYARLARPC